MSILVIANRDDSMQCVMPALALHASVLRRWELPMPLKGPELPSAVSRYGSHISGRRKVHQICMGTFPLRS